MGTNYYFEPKGYEKLPKINDEFILNAKKLRAKYLEDINNIIDNANKKYPLYKGFFHNYFDPDYTLNYSTAISPDVRICKVSYGWVPLFETNQYYSSIEELTYFYDLYKDSLVIKDEYDREFTFDEFIDIIKNHISNPNNKTSHLQYNSPLYNFKYYKDKSLGVEWTNTEFS